MDLLNKKINFHIHTKYSFDSLLEPSFIVDFLYKNGYDVAIITDHNTIKGALEAKDYAERKYKNKFSVIVGEEVKTDAGDIIGFPITDEIKPGDYKTVIAQMKLQNALICLPHPYKSHDLFLIHQEEFIREFNFIEVFNARINDNLNEYSRKLAEKFGTYKIVGNDAHVKEDLVNCSNYYRHSLNYPEFKFKRTHPRNVRKSQMINFYKKKNVIDLIKYATLFILGK